jgi:hypothetical protein
MKTISILLLLCLITDIQSIVFGVSGRISFSLVEAVTLSSSRYFKITENSNKNGNNTDNSNNLEKKSKFRLNFIDKLKNNSRKEEFQKEERDYFHLCLPNGKKPEKKVRLNTTYRSTVTIYDSEYGSQNIIINVNNIFICNSVGHKIALNFGDYISVSAYANDFATFYQRENYYKAIGNFPATLNTRRGENFEVTIKVLFFGLDDYDFDSKIEKQYNPDNSTNGKNKIDDEENFDESDDNEESTELNMNFKENPFEEVSDYYYNKQRDKQKYTQLSDVNYLNSLEKKKGNDNDNDNGDNDNNTIERKLRLNKIFKEIKNLVYDSSIISKIRRLV